ncbi:hypothetical protein BJX66DRAFT_327598 [Aspergillus keveii]|uniref:NAD(P)-binding protein n=1 Tax=Aspergillus keveii TaxID=714993 RepID=A0ABR4FX20_9EURO
MTTYYYAPSGLPQLRLSDLLSHTDTEAQVILSSQRGRVFIAIGGNTAIGFELCKILYPAGATVYVAHLSKKKSEGAIESRKSTIPNPKMSGSLKFLQLDLNDLRIVQAAADSFASQESKLDVLWSNTGTGANGPASSGHPNGITGAGSPPNGIELSVLCTGIPNKPAVNYGASKAGTWLLSRAFARRYMDDEIVSFCVNPGYLKAASIDGTPGRGDPVFGAYTVLFTGLSSDVQVEDSAAYLIPWGRIREHKGTPKHDFIRAGRAVEEVGWCE